MLSVSVGVNFTRVSVSGVNSTRVSVSSVNIPFQVQFGKIVSSISSACVRGKKVSSISSSALVGEISKFNFVSEELGSRK